MAVWNKRTALLLCAAALALCVAQLAQAQVDSGGTGRASDAPAPIRPAYNGEQSGGLSSDSPAPRPSTTPTSAGQGVASDKPASDTPPRTPGATQRPATEGGGRTASDTPADQPERMGTPDPLQTGNPASSATVPNNPASTANPNGGLPSAATTAQPATQGATTAAQVHGETNTETAEAEQGKAATESAAETTPLPDIPPRPYKGRERLGAHYIGGLVGGSYQQFTELPIQGGMFSPGKPKGAGFSIGASFQWNPEPFAKALAVTANLHYSSYMGEVRETTEDYIDDDFFGPGQPAHVQFDRESELTYNIIGLDIMGYVAPAPLVSDGGFAVLLGAGATVAYALPGTFTQREYLISPDQASFPGGAKERVVYDGEIPRQNDIRLALRTGIMLEIPVGPTVLSPGVFYSFGLNDITAKSDANGLIDYIGVPGMSGPETTLRWMFPL